MVQILAKKLPWDNNWLGISAVVVLQYKMCCKEAYAVFQFDTFTQDFSKTRTD